MRSMAMVAGFVLVCVCLFMPNLACSKFICSTNDTTYLMHNEGVRFSLKLLFCRARVLPALYGYHASKPFSSSTDKHMGIF